MFTCCAIKAESLGNLLKTARQNKGLLLKEVADKIKISAIYLQALEENNYTNLPSPAYVRGFLKNYAEILGLEPPQILSFYQQENNFFEKKEQIFRQRSGKKIKKPSSTRHQNAPTFNLRTLGALIIIFGLLFYFAWSIGRAILPPPIIISSPADNFETKEKNIQIKGTTQKEAVVKINDQPIAKFEKGIFEEKVSLTTGINLIKISAKKPYSPESVVKRRIIVKD